jgi:hypothetical protein
MKNQYFGDIHDYRKYGLIRLLTGYGKVKTAVCWMLTAGDGGPDGRKLNYLRNPAIWRQYDPELYDGLRNVVIDKGCKDVSEAKAFLPSCIFYDKQLVDGGAARGAYFTGFMKLARGCNLVFFDPDNGIEVRSTQYGLAESPKYLYWRETMKAFHSNHSILIYQHFPMKRRETFIKEISYALSTHTGAKAVYRFCTPQVLFLLVPQPDYRDFFHQQGQKVNAVWGNQIRFGVEKYH